MTDPSFGAEIKIAEGVCFSIRTILRSSSSTHGGTLKEPGIYRVEPDLVGFVSFV